MRTKPSALERYDFVDDGERCSSDANVSLTNHEICALGAVPADKIDGNRLAQQIDFLEKHNEVGLLGGQLQFIDPTGNTLFNWRYPLNRPRYRSLLFHGNAFADPAGCVKGNL